MVFEWFEEETFLIMRSAIDAEGVRPPDSVAIISRDDSSKQYQMLYYDERGVSRIYGMSFENDTWKLWRDIPGFSQRFEVKASADRRSMEGSWSKSTDGKTWQLDFNLKYQKKLQGNIL